MPPEPGELEEQEVAEGQEEQEEQETAPLDQKALVTEIVTQVTTATSSEIDRRINALMKTLTGEYGLKKAAGAPESTPKPDTDDRLLKRLRRSAVSETVTNAKLPDEESRSMVRKLALRLADSMPLDSDEDDYQFAERIVKEVTDEVVGMKSAYEKQVLADLKKRGLLTEEDGGGQPPKTRGKHISDPTKEFEAGAEKAKSMFPA